ncbi:MAG: hypothetical protein JAY69_03975 [Candidatus Thiodiazotropha taylori]|nr:hypothetical protein [Candidatus Thiodiazotropha taylori]MCW4231765.1 hypothetical protein [Candidatus Thiodiazotropha taylori]
MSKRYSLTDKQPYASLLYMSLYHRQISAALALVMVFTTVFNAVLVYCTSGWDHQAIELIGHQFESTAHAADASAVAISHVEEAHPEVCADSPLLGDFTLSHNKISPLCSGDALQLFVVLSFSHFDPTVSPFAPMTWSIVPGAPPLRSAIHDLSTIRLLV